MIWNTFPTTNFQPADIVLGQPDFISRIPNNNGLGISGAPSVSNLNLAVEPILSTDVIGGFLFSNGVQLFIADANNNRVLIWNTFPNQSFQPADVVLGQPDFTTNTPVLDAQGLYTPTGAYQYGQQLFVADQNNNRVLIYDGR